MFCKIFSIFSKTAGVSFGITSRAFKFSRTCAGLDAPRMTVLVFGLIATHARASCATVQPSSTVGKQQARQSIQ